MLIPEDYDLFFEDNIPSIEIGFHVMFSELSWLQKTVVVSNLSGVTYKGRFYRETKEEHSLVC